ncbi:unnamed protein product [Lymnaea stagnalis]|uniref:IQ domain-containing protein E n=1 Tax=Lymnaea stagnalis TaxID=6523 RepID=A0AAV2H0V2_LYMST
MAEVISRNRTTPRMHAKKSGRRTPRRPVTPGKLKTGKDLWMVALKKRQTLTLSNGYRPTSPRHRTPTEFFIDTLRKTGVGLSTETNKNQSLTGLPRGNTQAYPYLSTSHYMRQVMGVENSARTENGTLVRQNFGTPAYKTQEEYYDEVLSLRKQIAALSLETATNKTKIRRLEEDNVKKEKEIEGLLNPGKNGELRRTIGDRQADSGAVVHSYKQKILKLETQLKDKEAAFSKLQSDLKTTKLDEMRVQLEAVYSELLRLQMSKDSVADKSSSSGRENTAKVKALSETVIRLSKSNEQLQADNKALKDDLNRIMENADSNVDVKKEYTEMNRNELLKAIKTMEKKLEQAEQGMYDNEDMSARSYDTPRKTQGKIELRGSLEDRLQQLDQRETQLLQEVDRLRAMLKKSREERKRKEEASSLPPTPRRRNSIISSQAVDEVKTVRQLKSEAGSRPGTGVRSDTGSRPSTAVRVGGSRPGTARSDTGSRPGSALSREGKVESFKQKHAATSIQRRWRQRQQIKTNSEVEAFRENRAAKKIQHGWFDYKKRHYDEEMDDAAFLIQGTLKGHHIRHQKIGHPTEMEDDVYLIQSSLRGHKVRQQKLRTMRNMEVDEDGYLSGRRQSSPLQRPPTATRPISGGSRRPSDSRPSTSSRRVSVGSLQRPSSASIAKRGSTSQVFQAKYDMPPSGLDDDDDDDIMI